jgi:hypothetical protein
MKSDVSDVSNVERLAWENIKGGLKDNWFFQESQ